MNTLNKILLLIIILCLINYLTDCKLTNVVKSYFYICKNNTEQFMGLTYTNKKGVYYNHPNIPYNIQNDFAYNNGNKHHHLDENTYNLYDFMKNLINVNTNNYELSSSNRERIVADDILVSDIMNQLDKILNHHHYTFNNIKLLDTIYYYNNYRGKEIELFNISADVLYKGNYIGSVVMNFETFMRKDIINSSRELLIINNVRLISRTNNEIIKEPVINSPYNATYIEPDGYLEPSKTNQRQINSINPTKEHVLAEEHSKKMADKMTESFNNHFVGREDYDNLFIKPKSFEYNENDTENSLIPSIINMSSYEDQSVTPSTGK